MYRAKSSQAYETLTVQTMCSLGYPAGTLHKSITHLAHARADITMPCHCHLSARSWEGRGHRACPAILLATIQAGVTAVAGVALHVGTMRSSSPYSFDWQTAFR